MESKSAALVAAVFVDFPENKCNFLPKNSETNKKKVAAGSNSSQDGAL